MSESDHCSVAILLLNTANARTYASQQVSQPANLTLYIYVDILHYHDGISALMKT